MSAGIGVRKDERPIAGKEIAGKETGGKERQTAERATAAMRPNGPNADGGKKPSGGNGKNGVAGDRRAVSVRGKVGRLMPIGRMPIGKETAGLWWEARGRRGWMEWHLMIIGIGKEAAGRRWD